LWWVFFKIGSCELFDQGWLWTAILLISASWVARITGVCHWCLATMYFFIIPPIVIFPSPLFPYPSPRQSLLQSCLYTYVCGERKV
jgi:hypothetical protein